MPSRRDFLIGGACASCAVAGYALTPRRETSLLGNVNIEKAVPDSLPGWSSSATGGIITPPSKGSLADRLYSQTVQRVYENPAGAVVMLLIAYGSTQSDDLQLHRPESCYPAVGFQISDIAPRELALASQAQLPIRELSARLDQRSERILYWARLGEYLPNSNVKQREARIRNALAGLVTDGVLVRFSTLAGDVGSGDAVNEAFVREFVANIGTDLRRVLLGSDLSRRLAGTMNG